jgi:hypothetical protein
VEETSSHQQPRWWRYRRRWPRVGGQQICARLSLRAACLPPLTIAVSSARARFGSVQPDSVHSSVPPPHSRHGRTAESDGRRESRGKNALRPSRANIWRLFTFTCVCTAGRPPKPTCRNIFASIHLQCTRWCSHSNAQASSERVARSIEMLVDPKCLPELL